MRRAAFIIGPMSKSPSLERLYSHQHDLTLLGHVLPTVFFHKATGGTGFDYCVLDDLWNMEPMGGELPMGGQMGGSRKEVKTPKNFLGENSALVNLDNLMGPSKPPAVPGMPPSCKIGFRTGTVELIIYFICGQGTNRLHLQIIIKSMKNCGG